MPKTIALTRWTVERAASEFPIDAKTLSKRLKQDGILPGTDGKFSTEQICKATFGDLRGEQTRLARESADAKAIENQKARNELAEVALAVKFCAGVGVVIRQKILAASLDDDEKDELLADLKKLFDAGTVTEQICAAAD